MRSNDYIHMNLYHAGIMLDSYLLLEPNVSCSHILKIQLLFPLLENCHNPGLFEVLLQILEPFTSKYDVFGQTQVHIWTFCLEKGFFNQATMFLLNESKDKGASPLEDESKTAHLMLEKAEKYYSQQKTQMIKMEMVKKLGGISNFLNNLNVLPKPDTPTFEIFNTSLDSILGPLQTQENGKESLKIEEFQGKKPDIDYLKGFIKEINLKKSQNNQDNSTKFKEEPLNLKENNTKHKENHNLDLDPFRTTTSSLDFEKGFTSSRLMSLYPTRFLLEHVALIDSLATKPEYQLNNLKESEKIAFPVGALLNQILYTVVDYENRAEKLKWLKIRRVEGVLVLLDMFFQEAGVNFNRVLVVILKIPLIYSIY